MRIPPKIKSAVGAVLLTLLVEAIGVYAFLSGIHGPAAGRIVAAIAFPVAAPFVRSDFYGSTILYASSILAGATLWGWLLYVLLEYRRKREPWP